jgi:hypothetical protein
VFVVTSLLLLDQGLTCLPTRKVWIVNWFVFPFEILDNFAVQRAWGQSGHFDRTQLGRHLVLDQKVRGVELRRLCPLPFKVLERRGEKDDISWPLDGLHGRIEAMCLQQYRESIWGGFGSDPSTSPFGADFMFAPPDSYFSMGMHVQMGEVSCLASDGQQAGAVAQQQTYSKQREY